MWYNHTNGGKAQRDQQADAWARSYPNYVCYLFEVTEYRRPAPVPQERIALGTS